MGGYAGRVEYAQSSHAQLEIDDLDRPDWNGTPSGILLLNGNAPDDWLVGVVLLDGPRAGASALATLTVRRSGERGPTDARFEGRTPFGPTADPLAAAEAERRYAEMQARVGQLKRQLERSPGSGEAATEFEPRGDESYELAVLNRPRSPRDATPPHMDHRHVLTRIREGTLRLALEHAGHTIYVAEGIDDSLFLIHESPGGGGASGGPMSNITERGAMVSSSESAGYRIIIGIVPDAVTSVRSHERDAVMGENAFLLDADNATIADLTFVTTAREYSMNRQPPKPPPTGSP